jgi:hypothetical protein
LRSSRESRSKSVRAGQDESGDLIVVIERELLRCERTHAVVLAVTTMVLIDDDEAVCGERFGQLVGATNVFTPCRA